LLYKTILSDYRQFPDIYISQGSVATCMRCGGFFNDHFYYMFTAEFVMKELWRSVNIWQETQEYGRVSWFVDSRVGYVEHTKPKRTKLMFHTPITRGNEVITVQLFSRRECGARVYSFYSFRGCSSWMRQNISTSDNSASAQCTGPNAIKFSGTIF